MSFFVEPDRAPPIIKMVSSLCAVTGVPASSYLDPYNELTPLQRLRLDYNALVLGQRLVNPSDMTDQIKAKEREWAAREAG